MKAIARIFWLSLLAVVVMALFSCKRTKELTRTRERIDSIGTIQFRAMHETRIKERATGFVTVPQSDVSGVFDLCDTGEQVIESNGLILRLKPLGNGKAKASAVAKEKKVPFSYERSVISRSAANASANAHVRKDNKGFSKAKEQKGLWFPWYCYVMGVLVVAAGLYFALKKWPVKAIKQVIE